ncbi:glycoside hydrolase family 16 protein [Jatrophihabitans lederbergiae]|uniref:Glycoside hydrolase family 16 protein n=1 Tax=Jatrophihabitans lederbergiae TaxID=3075547 RepID=A0ABU2JAS8_9ACTN|nr:glycoside hydrolase family 16 protein [Jatrophihabitans sp. DSM 44399]MDT0261838.1 glycoside hydrolase family 16 protein [Jatrophihabitans sp. DSM 44399]
MTRTPGTPPAGRRPRWRALLVGTAAVLLPLSATTALAHSATAAVPAPPTGWTSVFSDDFAGASGTGLNTSNWLYDLGTSYPGGAGNWGTGEVESNTNSTANVYQDGAGHLAIKPIRDASGHWTSGRVETQRTDFAAPTGGVLRVQASIQQPDVTTANGAGYWPAFWMLGDAARAASATNWPSIGEIDIMEDINGRSSEFATLHCGTGSGGPCNETTGIGSGERACSGCQTAFHQYAMEYDRSVSPEQLRYYLDGTNFFTINSNQVDATTWNNATHHGFFLIMNVAMGGGFPNAFGGGPTAATVSGQPMLVDYVSVMTKGGTSTGGGTGTGGGGGSATATTQAEAYNAQSGTATEACSDTGGGQDVGNIGNGDWLQYNNTDFGTTALHTINARVASGAASGVSGIVEVHLDSLSNAAVGSFSVGNTGGWQSWKTVPGSIGSVTGTHTVYLKFVTGSGQDFVNVNSFSFS